MRINGNLGLLKLKNQINYKMPALNFKAEFVPGILAMLDPEYAKRTGIKAKTTTIRATRKHPIRKGERLYLYTGQRTKRCRKLGEVVCAKVQNIIIVDTKESQIHLDGYVFEKGENNRIAREDGFKNADEMISWFRKVHGLPFYGQRIHLTNTYNRKYFLNKKVKEHGFELVLETTQKTINVRQEDFEKAENDRYVKELSTKHNYGIQIINPLIKEL